MFRFVISCDSSNFQLLVLIHKFFYHKEKLPVIFASYFNANFLFHNYDTCNRDNLHLAICKTSYGLKCIKYKVVIFGINFLLS